MAAPLRRFIKELNRFKILDAIRSEGLISRIDLSRKTGLSQASITGLTADLTAEGLIEEKKSGAYQGGRRPMLLSIRPEGAYVVGVDLSMTSINVVVLNLAGEIVTLYSLKLTKQVYSPGEIADLTALAIKECMWDSGFSKDQISGIGLGIPGLVDAESGIIRFLPNYGWENIRFREALAKRIKHPIYIDNSSNNLAATEQLFGDGKGADDFVVVTIENGVGTGIVVNGRLVRGGAGTAGEFGHFTIDPDGPICRCGKKGCVEAFCGNNSIIREAKRACEKGLVDFDDPLNIDFEDVMQKLSTHADIFKEIYYSAGKMLGIGISYLMAMLNPEKIIITGKGVKAGDFLFDPMFTSIDECISKKFGNFGTRFIIKDWAWEDWAQGAGTLVLNELFKSPVEKNKMNDNKEK
jgi:predicted NBD/HSP70 family sugar kinase